MTVSLGETVNLQCLYNGSRPDSTPNVTWWRILQGNATWPDIFWSYGQGPHGELTISTVNKSHIGMYRCQVEEKGHPVQKSCGTYLRVRGECQPPPHRSQDPHPCPFCEVGMEPVPPSILGILASGSARCRVGGFSGLARGRAGKRGMGGEQEALVL